MKLIYTIKKGFGLLEIVFALAISSILSIILFQSLIQGNKIFNKVVTLSSHERAITMFEYILEKEISGIFSPSFSLQDRQLESNSDDTFEKNDDKNKDQSDKNKDDKIKKSFFYEHDEAGNLKLFTFITKNTLSVYGEPNIHMSRVVYRLENDLQNPDTFILLHQQSEDLDFKRFEIGIHNGIKAYQVINRIKSIKFEFLIDKKEEKKEEKKENSVDKNLNEKDSNKDKVIKKIREFEVLTEWKDIDRDKDKKSINSQEKKDNHQRPDIPVFIRITLVIYDIEKRLHTYQYWYAPQYDIQPFLSKKITNMSSRKNKDSVFNEHQDFLSDAGGSVR